MEGLNCKEGFPGDNLNHKKVHSYDWWLPSNKNTVVLNNVQVTRSQFPGSCYTHALAEAKQRDREQRKYPQLLKDKSKQENVLPFCGDIVKWNHSSEWKNTYFKFHRDQRDTTLDSFPYWVGSWSQPGCFIFPSKSSMWRVHSGSPAGIPGTPPCVHFRHGSSIRKRWSSPMRMGGAPISCPCLFWLMKRMCLSLCHWTLRLYWLFGPTLQPSIYLSKHLVHLELPDSASVYAAKPRHTLGRNARRKLKLCKCLSDSVDRSLSKLREMVMDREAWHAAVRGSQRVGHD